MVDAWPLIESEIDYDCGWFRVGRDRVVRPDGHETDHFWVDADTDAVAILPLTDGGDVVMVEQYRPKFRETCLELPAGGVEPHESYEAAARRELREETGYRAETVEILETYRPMGIAKMGRAIAVATGLCDGDPDPDDGEFLAVHHVPAAEALERVRDGPTTGWSLTPLLLAQLEGYR
jgi:ADP-ribose pyrophosphatase